MRSIRESNSSRENAVSEPDGMCIQAFVYSAWSERGEEAITWEWISLDSVGCLPGVDWSVNGVSGLGRWEDWHWSLICLIWSRWGSLICLMDWGSIHNSLQFLWFSVKQMPYQASMILPNHLLLAFNSFTITQSTTNILKLTRNSIDLARLIQWQ